MKNALQTAQARIVLLALLFSAASNCKMPSEAQDQCVFCCQKGEIFGRMTGIGDENRLDTNCANHAFADELNIQIDKENGIVIFCSNCGLLIDGNAFLKCESFQIDLGQPFVHNWPGSDGCLEFAPPAALWTYIEQNEGTGGCALYFNLQIDCAE